MRSLRIKALNLRNRLLASSRFRSFAGAFWPTRYVARHRASDVFDIVAGFAYSQTLYACVDLDLFSMLREGPLPRDEIGRRLGLDAEGTRTLLEASTALRLLESPAPEFFGLGVLGAAIVDDDAIKGMIRHHAHFYRDMANPVALLKERTSSTALAGYWPYAEGASDEDMDSRAVADYTHLMSSSQPMICEQVHAAYNLGQHQHLMDVGGGNGAFLMSAAREDSKLKLTLFDREPVSQLARDNLSQNGLLERVSVRGGDFTQDDLPIGADVISLVRILHDHDDDVVLALLRKVRAALPVNGRVLIAEPLANTAGSPRMGSVYFSFYLRAMGSGRPRRFEELREMLGEAGFVAVQHKKTRIPMLASVVVATTPT
ncbi:MAG: methyltransferase [Gammaproteobacteria bacterium]